MSLLGRLALAALCCALMVAAPYAAGASTASSDALTFRDPDTVDNSELMHDLTLTRSEAGHLTMTMWLPEEFWRTQLRHKGSLTERGIDDYLAVVHPYTLMTVLDGQFGVTSIHYTDPETLAAQVTLEDSHGERYAPLPPESVSEDMRNMLQAFRPIMANMMGAMGQHMEFLIFPSLDKGGHALANAKSSSSLIVHVGETVLRYRLPGARACNRACCGPRARH
jgi:hypothetical protein